jgi:hypothetical protein
MYPQYGWLTGHWAMRYGAKEGMYVERKWYCYNELKKECRKRMDPQGLRMFACP